MVEIALSHQVRWKSKRACDAVKHVFNRKHALWSAKASECGLRSLVRTANVTSCFQRWNEVSVIGMKQGARQNRLGQVQAPAAIRIERELQRLDSAAVLKAHGKAGEKRKPVG